MSIEEETDKFESFVDSITPSYYINVVEDTVEEDMAYEAHAFLLFNSQGEKKRMIKGCQTDA